MCKKMYLSTKMIKTQDQYIKKSLIIIHHINIFDNTSKLHR